MTLLEVKNLKKIYTVVICNVNQWKKLLCSSYNKQEVRKREK